MRRILDTLKQTWDHSRERLIAETSKIRHTSFLNAVVASAVLVSAADGTICSSEKQKLFEYIRHSEELRHFSTEAIIATFTRFVSALERSDDTGKAELLNAVRLFKDKPEQARLIIRIAVVIAKSDGTFDDAEQMAIFELCQALDLNPADFLRDATASPQQSTQRRTTMSVSLAKGGNVSLSKEAPGLESIMVGLGWDARLTDGAEFDLDASCFLLNAEGKVRSDADFIFYNNKVSTDGSVEHQGDNRTGEGDGDDEKVAITLTKVPAEITKLAFTVTIHEAEQRGQNFGMVSNAFIRIVNNANGQEIARFDLSEDASTNTAMIFGEVYRHNGEWKFRAVGQGYDGGLAALARNFGVNV